MKKEIKKADFRKIVTLLNLTTEVVTLLEAEEKYIKYLFKHFQEDKYYSTNFFISDTLENKVYNNLDNWNMEFKYTIEPFLGIERVLNNLLIKIEDRKIIKIEPQKEQKNNENN